LTKPFNKNHKIAFSSQHTLLKFTAIQTLSKIWYQVLTILIMVGFNYPKNLTAQTNLPEDFTEEFLDLSFEFPLGLLVTDNNNMLVWEKVGKIWVVDNDDNKGSEPLIDISEEIMSAGDHGLLSVVLDPNFSINGYIYLYFVVDRHHLLYYGTDDYDPEVSIEGQATIGRVSRYTIDVSGSDWEVDYNSRKVIFGSKMNNGLPILMASHGTGCIVFGEDGTLMVSCGDGGSFTEVDVGNAVDTYHEQAIQDGIIPPENNVGAFRSMMINSANGKLLRIDPITGFGLPSNPFYDEENPDSPASKVWVYGLRNPYRLIHVPNTGSHNPEDGQPGSFLVGDVGSYLWEELNLVDTPGHWFGWPLFEGYESKWEFAQKPTLNPEMKSEHCPDGYYHFQDTKIEEYLDERILFDNSCAGDSLSNDVLRKYIHRGPFLAYNNDKWNTPIRTKYKYFDMNGKAKWFDIDHENSTVEGVLIEGGSIIPGSYNRYDNFPEKYKDRLFLADFHGYVFSLDTDSNLDLTTVEPFLRTNEGVSDLRFNPKDGCLYYIHILNGHIRRVCYGGVLAPKVVAEADAYYGTSPLTVQLDASKSIDYSETFLDYEWDFGDGTIGEGETILHEYKSTGIQSYTVTLTVTDQLGNSNKKDLLISLNNSPPIAEIVSIVDGQTYAVTDNNVFELIANVEDNEHSDSELEYAWRVDLYHDEHFHPGATDNKHKSIAIIEPLGCGGIEQYWHRIHLTVTDPEGLKATDAIDIFPNCQDPFVEFLELEGYTLDSQLHLNWDINVLKDFDHFVVENTNGEEFRFSTKLDFVLNESTYNYIDPKPFEGFNNYRILAFDEDNNYIYSNSIQINFYKDGLLELSPNPSYGDLAITLYKKNMQVNDEVSFSLYTEKGELMWDQTEMAQETRKLQVFRSVHDLAEGIYFIHASYFDEIYIQKFIKY